MKKKEWINVTKQASNIISFHTADKEIWQKIREELNLIGKPTKFNEGSSQVERFIGEKFTLESLKPEKGIDLKNNEVFEIYIYRNKKE